MVERKETEQELEQRNKRAEMYEKCNKRLALIYSKFPNIQEAPASIQEEARKLGYLRGYVEYDDAEWGFVETSNGVFIDSFLKDKYEKALDGLQSLKEENLEYISKEEEAEFEYPELNLEEINNAIDNMKSLEDSRRVQHRINELLSGYHSNEQNRMIQELYEKWGNTEIKPADKEETKLEATPPVKISKFAQIYEKAKGKLRGLVSNIKSLFSKENYREEKEDNSAQDRDE